MEAKTIRRVIARQLLDSAPDRLGGRPEHDRYEWRKTTPPTPRILPRAAPRTSVLMPACVLQVISITRAAVGTTEAKSSASKMFRAAPAVKGISSHMLRMRDIRATFPRKTKES